MIGLVAIGFYLLCVAGGYEQIDAARMWSYPSKEMLRHLDGNPRNNDLSNLQVRTARA